MSFSKPLSTLILLFILNISLFGQQKSLKELDRAFRKDYKHKLLGEIKCTKDDKRLLISFLKDNLLMCQFNYINDTLRRIWFVKKNRMTHAYFSEEKIIAGDESNIYLPDMKWLNEKSNQLKAIAEEIVKSSNKSS